MLERAGKPPADRRAESQWLVPLADVAVDDEIEAAACSVVRSGWWSMGPEVAAFEDEFARFVGAKHALAVANGTAALHLALVGLGCQRGDEVVLPSLNFVAAANTIVHTGATPAFCDVTADDDLTLSPDDLAAAITAKTRAVVVMHYGGHPCRLDAICELAERHRFAVIEDAAHAPGATWRDRACGTIGDVGCFSFFSNKNMPMGEGGMVVTDDDALAGRLRLFRSHGMTTLTWDRHRGHASTYDVVVAGFNYRLDELRAAIGRVELQRLPQSNDDRARIVAAYRDELDGVNGLHMPFAGRDASASSHHLAVLLLPEGRPRDEFRAALAADGVQTSVHYPPIHRFVFYRALGSGRPLPVTDAVADRIVTLPLYPHMRDDQVALVTKAVRAAT